MVTRKFKASPVKVQGITPTGVLFESALEEDALFLKRFEASRIESIQRCDIAIPWFDANQKRHTYRPDFLIRFKPDEDGVVRSPLIIEVKPDFEQVKSPKKRLKRRETEEERTLKWAAATNYALLNEMEFRPLREHEIRTPKLRNVKFLIRYLESPVPDRCGERICAILRAKGPTGIKRLMEALEPDRLLRAELYPTLWMYIAQGRLQIDLETLMHDETKVSLL